MNRSTKKLLYLALLVPGFVLASATPQGPAVAVSRACAIEAGTQLAQGCCKICRKGKACGDTCIARDKICHKGPGCACDG